MLYDWKNCFGGVVDTVIYGEVLNESDPWVDDLGNIPSVLTPKPKSGQSLGRVPDGFDSDIGSDFQLLDFVSPWEPNDLQPTCDGSDFVKSMDLFPIQTQKKRLRMKHMNGLNYIITRNSQLIWVVGVFNGERVVFPIFYHTKWC